MNGMIWCVFRIYFKQKPNKKRMPVPFYILTSKISFVLFVLFSVI